MAKIYRIPLGYRILRVFSNHFFFRWFSSVEVNGADSIPENASVIFAPNHQNAFTDAMALLSTSPQPVIFFAKADIFRRKLADRFLRWLKIMPAYRMRDGFENLKKNADSFNDAVKVLMHKEYFCLMPEGGQDEKRKLRPLVKGIFRVGFSAQSQYQESDNVWIVPTGFDYGNYDHSGSHLIVNYGKPINLRDYYKEYQENPAVTQNKLRDELSKRISPLMLDIRSDEHYDAFYTSAYICNYNRLEALGWEDNETNRLLVRQQIVKSLDQAAQNPDFNDDLARLDDLTKQWRDKHSNIELTATTMEYGSSFYDNLSLVYPLVYSLLMLPAVAYSLVFNGPVAALIKWGNGKWGVPGFYSTVSLVAGMVLFPIWHLILILTVGLWIYNNCHWGYAAAFALSLPYSYFFSLRYYWNAKYLYHRLKNIFCKDDLTDKISDLVDDIIERLA